MDRYIGLDVHSQSCTLAVVGLTGKRVGLQVVETNGAALKQAMRTLPGSKHVCLEEGTQSAWIYELLEEEVDELVVTIPEKHVGPKDDARDAWQLAEALRTGAIKRRVYKSAGPYSELRAAVRSYGQLRMDVRRAKSRLKAIFRSRGLFPGDDVYQEQKHGEWGRQLPPAQRRSAEMLRAEVESLMELWGAAEKRVHEASKPHAIMRTLATAPAIGPIRAAEIVSLVVTPHRFRTKRQFWAYCGLAIVMRSSADWIRDRHGKWIRAQNFQTRGLNRNRQPLLKEVFKGAAHLVATQMTSHPLHQDYRRLIEGGMKPNLAQLTIARRLAAAVLAMWKHEEVYDPEKHRTNTTAQA
jgi:transposase